MGESYNNITINIKYSDYIYFLFIKATKKDICNIEWLSVKKLKSFNRKLLIMLQSYFNYNIFYHHIISIFQLNTKQSRGD